MLPEDDNIYRGGGSGVGTGTVSPPDPEVPDKAPSDDYWPEQFDEAGNAVDPDDSGFAGDTVGQTDREIYRDSPAFKAGKAYQQKNIAARKASEYVGDKLLGDKKAFAGDTQKDRERVKEIARKKAREAAKKQLSKKMSNEAMKKGFEKGLEKGASKLAKEGVKKGAQAATKAAGKAAAKVGAQAATKTAQTAVTAAGAATGVETFGLGFLLAFLLNIAISLGVNDAVEAMFELKDGHVKQATFLAIRAAVKIEMFIVLLVGIVLTFSVAGFIIGIPIMIFLTIYMLLGFAFKKIPHFQGLVWWEMLIIVVIDIFAIIIFLTFLAGIGWYICDQIPLVGSTGIGGKVASGVAGIVDWATGSDWATSINEMCSAFKGSGAATTGGGDAGGAGAGGSF